MSTWSIISTESARKIWDTNLARFPEYSPFQAFSWGQYYTRLGWTAVYLVARDESDQIVGMMTGLVRKYPFKIGLLWVPGGPVGALSNIGKTWAAEISSLIGIRHLYFRIRFDRERNIDDVLLMNNAGWNRSWFIMQSSFTMAMNPSRTDKELLSRCSRSWRRNLRSSLKKNINIEYWPDPDIDELESIFIEMQQNKNLPALYSHNDLGRLFNYAGDNLLCMRALDSGGELLAVRICSIAGNRVCEYLAATNAKGRDSGASYSLFWAIIEECRKRGIEYFDLGGIDPHENPGVYAFKSKTGARPVELLGEWDWAPSQWLQWLGNWAIQRRQLGKQRPAASPNRATSIVGRTFKARA